MNSPNEISRVTQLLQRASQGDLQARERCYEVVQDKLRKIAETNMTHDDMLSLDATMVINDTWLNLIDVQNIDWENRQQFLCYAARTVRNILCDYARKRKAVKRSPGYRVPSLRSGDTPKQTHRPALTQLERDEEILALNVALRRLEENHPELARVVELQYFGGFKTSQIASDILNVDTSTVRRRWERGRLLLKSYLTEEGHSQNEA